MSASETGEETGETAVVLDVLLNGRPDDDRPPSKKSALAYLLRVDDFGVLEATLEEDSAISIADRVDLGTPEIERTRIVDLDELTGGARSELEYAVEAIVETDEERFVSVYEEAGPISLRQHQLDLLPGIGETLRNAILDERKRGPFDGFDELAERIDGLHRPKEILIERVLEELRENDLKHYLFVTADR